MTYERGSLSSPRAGAPAAHAGLRAGIGLLQVCAAGVLWGTAGPVVTVLHERDGLGGMTVSAWRMTVAAVALVGFVALTGRSRRLVAAVRTHPVTTIGVGCGTAAYQGLYFVSVLLVGVSVATVVSLGLAPVLTAVWEHALARTRPSSREVSVLVAALAGLVLVSSATVHGPGGPGERPGLGLLLAVAAGATYTATTVVGHGLARRVDPVALTTAATAAGALLLAPFVLAAAVAGSPVVTGDPVSLALLVYVGVATMAVAYGLLYAGLRTTSGSAATVVTLVEPLSAALLAILLLGERMTVTALLGGALILAAVVALRPHVDRPVPTRPVGAGRPDRAGLDVDGGD